MLSNRGTTVPDRLIRDEYETWSTLIAREFELIPSIAPLQYLISIGCLDSFPSSRLRLHPRIPPTPSSLRSLQFSNDISLSIPLSRNLYPRPRRVNRTVSSYSVSSSGRRQPGRRVELVCRNTNRWWYAPRLSNYRISCRAELALISVSPLSRCSHLAFRRTEKFSIYRGRGNSIEIDK